MGEKRICPVCENDIPFRFGYRCPHCHFEIERFGDEEAIAKAKQNFKGILYEFDDGAEERKQETNRNGENGLDFTFIGILGSILGFILAVIGGQIARNIFPQLIFTIILSFLTGLVWKTSIKKGKGCLFIVGVIIGVVAPVLLILILFPGGY